MAGITLHTRDQTIKMIKSTAYGNLKWQVHSKLLWLHSSWENCVQQTIETFSKETTKINIFFRVNTFLKQSKRHCRRDDMNRWIEDSSMYCIAIVPTINCIYYLPTKHFKIRLQFVIKYLLNLKCKYKLTNTL